MQVRAFEGYIPLKCLQSKRENKDISMNDLYIFSRKLIVSMIVMILKVKTWIFQLIMTMKF